MVVIVVSKRFLIGKTIVPTVNVRVWIAVSQLKKLGEMAEGVMANGTMLDVSLMVEKSWYVVAGPDILWLFGLNPMLR